MNNIQELKDQLDRNRKSNSKGFYDRNNPSYQQKLLMEMSRIAESNPRRSNWDIMASAIDNLEKEN